MNKCDSKPRILIVDDEPENISILVKALKQRYKLTVATNGSNALEHATAVNIPDLILLDIMMPGMDGYEVCRRLKADKTCRDIPVIFITAMRGTENETRGFELGAVDYITKPFDLDIVESRVRTHLELKRHLDYLEELAEHRARQIMHMERLSTLGMLSAGMTHEIKNCLNYVLPSADILEDQLDSFYPFLLDRFEHEEQALRRCFVFLKENRQKLLFIRKGIENMTSIIESMRRLSRPDDDEWGLVSIAACIREALILCQNELKYQIAVVEKIEQGIPEFYGNSQQIEQVFINLFKNAADAIRDAGQGTLEVSAAYAHPNIRVTVEDTGPGIPPDKIETIWQPFFTTKDAENGTGLGLSICKGIIEEHNGVIRAENRTGGGARFIIDLPVAGANEAPSRSIRTASSRKECYRKNNSLAKSYYTVTEKACDQME